MAASCPICEQRRGKRFCPGLPHSRWRGGAETICALCCGEQREVAIDCPSDCPFLVAAHRYEATRAAAKRRSRGAAPAEIPFPRVALDEDFLEEKQHLIAGLSLFLVRYAGEHREVHDAELLAALDALARSYQTLDSGVYYEQPPANPAARELFTAARSYLEQFGQEQQQRVGMSLRPGEVLRALVFLLRLGQLEGSRRPLSRRFLGFLRAQLPAEAASAREPRLIVPGS